LTAGNNKTLAAELDFNMLAEPETEEKTYGLLDPTGLKNVL